MLTQDNTMSEAILKSNKKAKDSHVRLTIPGEDHSMAHDIKRKQQVKRNEDVTVISVYLSAIKIGLKQLAKEAV